MGFYGYFSERKRAIIKYPVFRVKGGKDMSIYDSVLVSIFGISIVFIVLIALSFIVKIQSILISYFTKKKEQPSSSIESTQVSKLSGNIVELCNGEVALIDVDEKTAAMIMAIVSDEMETPLSELQFKYIKAVE